MLLILPVIVAANYPAIQPVTTRKEGEENKIER